MLHSRTLISTGIAMEVIAIERGPDVNMILISIYIVWFHSHMFPAIPEKNYVNWLDTSTTCSYTPRR